MTNELQAKLYEAQGYRVVSRKFGHIARIDRPDWVEHLRAKGLQKAAAYSQVCWEDHYRRCYTKSLVIPTSISRLMKGSNHDYTGYVEIKNDYQVLQKTAH